VFLERADGKNLDADALFKLAGISKSNSAAVIRALDAVANSPTNFINLSAYFTRRLQSELQLINTATAPASAPACAALQYKRRKLDE
jgi:hypothetical protein